MAEYSGCDLHKETSVFVEIDEHGELHGPNRVENGTDELTDHLESLPEGTPVAFETTGNWYWMADQVLEAGLQPRLVHAQKASARMGNTNKTDSLDAQELAILQKTRTLPESWIPPRTIRDQREALRLRMKLSESKVRWKNRIQALLNQYNVSISSVSDVFGVQGRDELETKLEELPEQTRQSVRTQLELLDQFEQILEKWDNRLDEILEDSDEREWVMSIPCIGPILSAVIVLEIGDIDRFPGPGHLASYAGTTPAIHQSGDHRTDKGLRKDACQYLKWAFFEAANILVRHQSSYEDSRLVRKYRRLRDRKNSNVAKGAVARMMAESTYWVLTKEEPYKEPG
jgi:transposase